MLHFPCIFIHLCFLVFREVTISYWLWTYHVLVQAMRRHFLSRKLKEENSSAPARAVAFFSVKLGGIKNVKKGAVVPKYQMSISMLILQAVTQTGNINPTSFRKSQKACGQNNRSLRGAYRRCKEGTLAREGLRHDDIALMNSMERDKYIKKDNIWKKPDYIDMIKGAGLSKLSMPSKRSGIPSCRGFHITDRTIRTNSGLKGRRRISHSAAKYGIWQWG